MNKNDQELHDRLVACIKDLFLNANPSIDINKLDHQIDPNDHVINVSKFEEILKKHKVEISDNVYLFVNKSPKIEGVQHG